MTESKKTVKKNQIAPCFDFTEDVVDQSKSTPTKNSLMSIDTQRSFATQEPESPASATALLRTPKLKSGASALEQIAEELDALDKIECKEPDDSKDDLDVVFKPKSKARKRIVRQASELVDVSNLLRINKGYVTGYVSCWAIGVWYYAFALGGNTQTTTIFEAKMGWTEDETIFYNTVISSAAIVGLVVGSFAGGPLIKNGRRRGALIANAMGVASAVFAMFGSVPFLTLGRFCNGFAAGTYNVIYGKMILENLPDKLAQTVTMFQTISVCFATLGAYLMGAFLPDPDDLEANKADEMWRLIFIMPGVIGIIEIVLILGVFKHEPVSFCIRNGDEEQSKAHMARLYRKADPNSPETIEELFEMQYRFQQKSTTMDASTTSMRQAVFGKKYRKASWICFLLNTFDQQTGINAVGLYANRFLVRM